MLQQSAHPQHQRIGGAISAQARVQAQPRSRASSQASSIAAGSNARSRAALLAGLEVNTSAIKSEDDAKSEYSAASASQPAAVAIPPVGFPPRPAQYAKGRDRAMAKADIGNESASSTEARMPNFEPPAASLVYPGARPVDFNPWMGNGPEDVLSEQTVKSGFGNKPSITNESNTARPVIWGPLKHKSGLQTLSSLFVAILEKRQASGKLTASSTFKPPPRVSLTNTKREAWLSDLANPAAALRKFNRTIPYGITGKGLLEQCLAKEIPTARAVWLAKCIGTNELRTLRRKGLSGALGLSAELKWVREWTIHVEQFLEATIQTRPDGAWKEKVQYIIRLTYHFFAEQLLDQDHFLDWVMASFEASSLERLPLWLVHVQLYWRYLVSTRKRGRRLAEALCASLDNMEKDAKTNNVLAPVSQRLRLLLGTLAVSQTACLIMPKSWNKFEGIIKGLTNRGQIASAIAVVTERNVRLAKPLWEQNPKSTVSPKRRAFDLLDAAGLDASVPDMCTKLYDLLPHTEAVVKLVLEWCCSPYRQGIHRVYVTSRVLRRIGMSGADVETHLLSFLMDPPSSSIQITNIIKTVAELVRAKSFAVLKVLRAVIARGAMADSQQSSAAAQRLRQLVRGIPTMGLPQHVGDLQRNLLREAVSQPKNQADITMTLKQAVQRTVFSDGAHGIDTYEAELLKTLNTAQRFELSAFVRLEILRLSKNFFNPGVLPPSSVQQNLTAQVFMAARDILENLEDFPLLADVVGICLRQCNGEMLAAIADTLHANAKEFGAIGALRPLSTQAFERYHVFRMDMPIEKGYVKALIGLLNATKGDASLVQRLTYDLARCDQRNALSMCSPASDNNLDLAATSGLDTAEEVERILASGTTMDEQSISRVFQRLTSHLIMDYDTQSKARTKGSWFERLRSFDESAFDMLVVEWMSDLLNVATADVGIYVITFLIGAGALSFTGVAAIDANLKQDNQMPSSMKHKLSVIMLSTLLFPAPSNRLGSLEDRYRFKLMQSDFAGEHVAAVLKQVGIALAIIDETVSSPDMESLFSILRSDVLRDFILRCAVEHRKPIQNHIMAALGGHATGTGVFRNIVEGMLETSTADTPSQEKIPRLVRTVGELSLPLCQLEMQLLLESTANSKVATSPPATNTSLLETASALFEAIMRSPDSERPPWIDLVDGLEPALLQRLRAIAEMQILKLVNEVCGHMKSDSISASIDGMQMLKIRALARRLLYVIDSTMTSHAPPTVPTSSTDTPGGSADAPSIDRFAPIRETLARHFVPDGSMRPTNRLSADLMCILLNALLHMLIVRKLALPTLPANNAADIASLLPVLLQIFPTSSVSTSKSTAEFLYDTAAYLSDDLADEARTTILKNEGSKYAYDPRVKFILGSPPDAVDKWLGLVTSNTVPSPTSGPISSSSAAATGLMGMAMAGTPSARFNPQTMPRPPNSRPSIAPPGLQRQQSGTLGNGGAISASGVAPLTAQNLKCFNAPVPFHLRRWELLPDQGTGAMGGMANDTAISLGLLGARRV